MIGYNINEFALEESIKSYLDEKMEAKMGVFLGTDFNDLEYPCVFITQVEAIEPEELHGTATMVCTLDIGVMTPAGMTRAQHKEYVAGVMDLIFNDDFTTELNAGRVDGLIVQRVRRAERRTTLDNDKGVRETTQRIEVLTSMNR